MGTFDDIIEDLFEDSDLGRDATFVPATGSNVACRVFVNRSVELQPSGYEVEVYDASYTLECRVAEIGREPRRGEQFVLGATTYTVKSVMENDGRVARLAVK